MKLIFAVILGLSFVVVGPGDAFSQTKKTIILVRHAEKDAVQAEMSGDPDLSAAGKERAERLAKIAGKYRPGAVFSSDTKRTRQTAEPTANHRHVEIQIYDPRKQADLVKQIMASKTRRFLIIGHSNTIPSLVNILINKALFKDLDDTEYGTIYLIRIRDGKLETVQVLTY